MTRLESPPALSLPPGYSLGFRGGLGAFLWGLRWRWERREHGLLVAAGKWTTYAAAVAGAVDDAQVKM